jgi:hypothetical protein
MQAQTQPANGEEPLNEMSKAESSTVNYRPGPYRVEFPDGPHGSIAHIVAQTPYDYPWVIATLILDTDPEQRQIGIATAYLLAASATMHAALAQLVEEIREEDVEACERWDATVRHALKQVEVPR